MNRRSTGLPRALVLAAGLLALGPPLAARAQVERVDPGRCSGAGDLQLCATPGSPAQGASCWIEVTRGKEAVEGAEVIVTYRPNSEVAETHRVGRTDGSGRVRWTPAAAGIATIAAEAEEIEPISLTVSVRFRQPPWLGIAILILAAMILFGGNGYSFAKTFARSG